MLRTFVSSLPILSGFLSTALAGAAGYNDPEQQSCSKGALNYLACHNGIPNKCLPEIAPQAVEFCSRYLVVTSTRLATSNRVKTVTVTTTQTLGKTATKTSVSTTATTAIQTSTVTTTTATSTTTVTAYAAPSVTVSTLVPRDAPGPHCDLNEKKLTRLPAEKLSSVCKCLGVKPTTVVATATTAVTSTSTASATSTTTTTTTVTTIVTSSSTTTKTSTTTTTLSNVATVTVTIDACSINYNPSGNGVGNTILTPGGVASARDCCILCWNTLDCVASAFPGGCQLLVKTTPLSDAPISGTCPLGIENYDFRPGPGVVNVGPCGVPPVA